ncbi:MFS transporter [Thalassotalea sp. PP2-459]|uniref:MFS transporter n=1 Tax=Thalassotalea sp. PP2-459 TaxID=1742724 RepID=UPI0009447DA3|nr:MFS transporter [Thalassotalea sp. PP2-459]
MSLSPRFLSFSFSYFAYFAIVGLVVPYLGVFLDGKGFNSGDIGELIAIFTATKIIGPTLWANAADKTGKLRLIIQLGAGLSLVLFSLLFWVENYWPIAFVLGIFSLFWTAIQPQLEVMTLVSVRRNANIYSRIRLWGSIGFIISVIIAGELLVDSQPDVFVILGWGILLALFISSLLLKQPKINIKPNAQRVSIFPKVIERNFILFFTAGLLLQISFGPYYSFFALYLRDLSYPSMAIGAYIGLGAVAEIGIFIIAGRLYYLFGPRVLLAISIFLTALRWYVTGHWADSAIILFFVQLLHAASFGLYHTASIQYLQQHFSIQEQNRAQAIYIAGVYGIGGALGAFLSGIFWLDGKGAMLSFELAAVTCVIAGILASMMTSHQKS